MFSTLTAQHLQMGALEAAAEAALSPEELDVFHAAIEVTNSVQTPRNHLGHWVWGYCKELPDALLLADPAAQKERDHQMILALQRGDAGHFYPMELVKLDKYDPETVMVYKIGDLERANRDMIDGHYVAWALAMYLDGIFTGKRKLPPHLKEAADRARVELFQQLYEKRQFREAWDRRRADRQNSHQSLRGSPPTAQTET
jgi:hypothetical protein